MLLFENFKNSTTHFNVKTPSQPYKHSREFELSNLPDEFDLSTSHNNGRASGRGSGAYQPALSRSGSVRENRLFGTSGVSGGGGGGAKSPTRVGSPPLLGNAMTTSGHSIQSRHSLVAMTERYAVVEKKVPNS